MQRSIAILRLLSLTLLVFWVSNSSSSASVDRTNSMGKDLSLISFNLYNRPINRDQRIDSAAMLLKGLDADIVAFQEVSQGWFLGKNPIDVIQKTLGYYREVFYYEDVPPIWQNGLAVLSRWPVRKVKNQTFDVNRFFNIKGFQHVVIETPSGDIDLVNLHMAATGRHSIKTPEFQQLSDYISSLDSKVIVLGDFNENRGSDRIEILRKKNPQLANVYNIVDIGSKSSHANSYGESCLSENGKLLDYIFFNHTGFSLLDAEIYEPEIEPPVSDHCLIRSRFQIN